MLNRIFVNFTENVIVNRVVLKYIEKKIQTLKILSVNSYSK